jgi:outer membrane protein TolC
MKTNLILFAILILMVSCGQKPEPSKERVKAIKVKTQVVQTANGLSNLHYSGTVEAAQTIPLTFQSSGTVEQVLVQEGDAVRKGQLLAVVNKADNQSIYNSSLAMYEQAKDGYDRLKQVYDKGTLKNNKKIIEAGLNVKSSEEVRKDAFTNYFPKVSACAMSIKSSDYLIKGQIPEMNLPVYDRNVENLASATQFAYFPATAINLMDYLNMASLSVSLPIYAGGQIRNGNKLAAIGEDVSRKQQTMTTTDVLVRTDQLYWTIVSLNEKLKTLDSYQALLDTLNRDVSNYTKAGLSQKNDLLKVQLKQNESQSNRLKLVNGISLTKMALCQHIGISYNSTLLITDEPTVTILFSESSSVNEAVANRSEYQMLNKATEAEELQLKMTRGELMPLLALGGMAAYVDVANSGVTQKFAFASLSIPITDWWGGSHKIKQQNLKIEKARNKLSETSELLMLQINQANNEIKESFDQVQLSQKSVEQAQENLKVTDDNYRSGNISISDLLEAQALLQSTNDNLTNSRCNYQIALSKYLQAIGKYE